MTPRVASILAELGEMKGWTIDFIQLVDSHVYPEWQVLLKHTQIGETRDVMNGHFREVLKVRGLELLLYSPSTLHIMPADREKLQTLELWNWFLGLANLTINVFGEGDQSQT